MCKKLQARDPQVPFDVDNANDRQSVVNIVVHTADLSAQGRSLCIDMSQIPGCSCWAVAKYSMSFFTSVVCI